MGKIPPKAVVALARLMAIFVCQRDTERERQKEAIAEIKHWESTTQRCNVAI